MAPTLADRVTSMLPLDLMAETRTKVMK